MGFYNWLHDFLFHLLSAPKSCWPEAAKPPMNKRGMKYGGVRKGSQLETMALAGILAPGYDALKYRDRKFLQLADEYEAGMITTPELYAQLELYIKNGPWNRVRFYRLKQRLNRKVIRLRKKNLNKYRNGAIYLN